MKKFMLLCLAGLLTACGGITILDNDEQDAVEEELPAMGGSDGQLCICRASNFVGGGGIIGMKINGQYIGDMPNSSFLCITLPPDEYSVTGDCSLCSRAGAETIIKLGQRKYMELYVGMNGINLHSTSREVGLSCIAETM